MLIAASILLALTAPVPGGQPPALPVWIVAWECSGAVSAGDEWTGAKIDVQADRVRFVEVVVRFDALDLAPDEGRWFERPTSIPIIDFMVWEQFCRDDCRDEILQEFLEQDSAVLVDRVSGGRNCRERVSVGLDGTRTSQIALEVVALEFRSRKSGLIVNPDIAPGELTCADERFAGQAPDTTAWINLRYDLDRTGAEQRVAKGDPPPQGSTDPLLEAAGRIQERLLDLLASRRPDPGTLLTGPPAVRLAEYEMSELAGLCDPAEDESGDHPGELAFSAAVSPRDVVRWTASIEARFGRSDWDREFAVRTLGDDPAPQQRDAILEILRTGVAGNDTKTASLALRALLKADPEEARRRAEPLLDHDELWRSACGVFVLSDPALARRFADRDEIAIEVRDEIREYLASEDSP